MTINNVRSIIMQRSLQPNTFNDIFRKAQLGDRKQQLALAKIYEMQGYINEAMQWYYLAANNGSVDACLKMASYCKLRRDFHSVIAWYNKAYAYGLAEYPQYIIIDYLIHFLNDPRYNPGKKRFSDAAINELPKGLCAGMTIRYLVGAYL